MVRAAWLEEFAGQRAGERRGTSDRSGQAARVRAIGLTSAKSQQRGYGDLAMGLESARKRSARGPHTPTELTWQDNVGVERAFLSDFADRPDVCGVGSNKINSSTMARFCGGMGVLASFSKDASNGGCRKDGQSAGGKAVDDRTNVKL